MEDLKSILLKILEEKYHHNHPYHRRMVQGDLSRHELQQWALNRYCYQEAIPIKDAIILSRLTDQADRRVWRKRIIDHDGDSNSPGGITKWLALTSALGLSEEFVKSKKGAKPVTRFCVSAYLEFVRSQPLVAAVASSLTELYSPKIIAERNQALLQKYDYLDEDAISYFTQRPAQARQDVEIALDFIQRQAETVDILGLATSALEFKCSILWTMLDGLHFDYCESFSSHKNSKTVGAMGW